MATIIISRTHCNSIIALSFHIGSYSSTICVLLSMIPESFQKSRRYSSLDKLQQYLFHFLSTSVISEEMHVH